MSRLPDPTAPLSAAWQGSLPDRLAAHAQAHGARVALVADSVQWSFAELDYRVDEVAAALRAGGVGRGAVVAVVGHRGPTLVVALLGVLRAGAAFLVVDPAWPASRLARCLGMVRPQGWIDTNGPAELGPEVEAYATAAAVRLDGRAPLPAPRGDWPTWGPDDRACIGFTSGSTGQPKGIAGRHGSLTHFLPYQAHRFGLGPEDRYSLNAGLSHDPLQREIFTALWTGAALHIPTDRTLGDPPAFAAWLDASAVTVLHATPSLLRRILSVERTLPALRRVFATGEALRWSDVRRLGVGAPHARVVNLYGATETQRAVGCFEALPADAPPEDCPVPLGWGMGDTQVLVLAGARLAQPGELGEICIRSPHLALGYLDGDPDGRFGPCPLDSTSQMYRTGDQGVFQADGAVVFRGRGDRQVKIRGHRIEPAEVEAALLAHPAVAAAVVELRETAEEAQLVAFVVPHSAQPIVGLRAWLRARLPEVMVPALWWVERLPLNPNGKVDRGALKMLMGAPAQMSPALLSPQAALIRAVWEEVVGRSVPGDADFFDVGGDSLAVLQVAARLQERGLSLPLRAFYEHTTLSALSACVPQEPVSVVVPDGGSPLSAGAEALWFLAQLEPESAAYNVSLAWWTDVAPDALDTALAQITARHLPLRAVVDDGGALVARDAPWRCTWLDAEGDTTDARAADAITRATAAHRQPFVLRAGPPRRALAIRVAPGRTLLVLVLHHIIADGWALGCLARELQDALAGRPLPTLTTSYAAVVAAQSAAIHADPGLLDWWRQVLAGAGPPELLPTAPPDPRGARQRRTLSAAATASLRALAQAEGATLFMAVVAVVGAALHHRSGASDVRLGADVAGRDQPGSSHLIGHFVNPVVLRVDYSGSPSFRAVLRRVRAATLGAMAHSALPFSTLVRALAPPRQAGRNPLFQVMVAMQEVTVDPPGWTSVVLDDGCAPLDLSVQIYDRPEGLGLELRHRLAAVSVELATTLAQEIEALCTKGIEQPDAPWGAPPRSRLAGRARRAVAGPVVRIGPPGLPTLIEPAYADVDLAGWITAAHAELQAALVRSGALLFRGFAVRDPAAALRAAVGGAPLPYQERSSPRHPVAEGVFTSTDHPAEREILLHNEQSYNLTFPGRIAFCCITPSPEQGATPIADTRRALARIPTALRERLMARRCQYVRTYGRGLGLSWQEAFQTDQPAGVASWCQEHAITAQWRPDGSLRTTQVRDVVARHPISGEESWFNHLVFFHAASQRHNGAPVFAGVPEADLPYDTRYGDGEPFDPDDVAILHAAYEAERVRFDWQTGDLLLLDNLLCAHGRERYAGPRQIVVAMGQPTRWSEVVVR